MCYINEIKGLKFNPYIPPKPLPALAGDVAYWDGSKVKTTPLSNWNTSLGIAIGVVVVPEGFAPDGKVRIVSLMGVDRNGNQSSSHVNMTWGGYDIDDTEITRFVLVPTTDNAGSTSAGSNGTGYLPSDKFTGAQSFIDPKAKYFGVTPYVPSPYLGEDPNPEYYKELNRGNVLSDFNGLSNTQTLVGLGSDCEAANAAWKFNDGASALQWYLPAMGELGYIMPRFNEINTTITALGGITINNEEYKYHWSSTYVGLFDVICLKCNDGFINLQMLDANQYTRPFAMI